MKMLDVVTLLQITRDNVRFTALGDTRTWKSFEIDSESDIEKFITQ